MKEIKSTKEELLLALALMYQQYCSLAGHLYMIGGETACGILTKENMLKDDGTGRGEVDYEWLYENNNNI